MSTNTDEERSLILAGDLTGLERHRVSAKRKMREGRRDLGIAPFVGDIYLLPLAPKSDLASAAPWVDTLTNCGLIEDIACETNGGNHHMSDAVKEICL